MRVVVNKECKHRDEIMTCPWSSPAPHPRLCSALNTDTQSRRSLNSPSAVQKLPLMSDSAQRFRLSPSAVTLYLKPRHSFCSFCLQTSVFRAEAWTWASSTRCLLEGCARAVRYVGIDRMWAWWLPTKRQSCRLWSPCTHLATLQ